MEMDKGGEIRNETIATATVNKLYSIKLERYYQVERSASDVTHHFNVQVTVMHHTQQSKDFQHCKWNSQANSKITLVKVISMRLQARER